MAHRRNKRRSKGNQALIKRLVVVVSALATMVLAFAAVTTLVPGWQVPGADHELAGQRATVTTDVLNVRAEPSTDAAILGSYRQGETVEVMGGSRAGFLPIQYGGGQAWMASEFLSIDGGNLQTGNIPVVAAAELVDVPGDMAPDEKVAEVHTVDPEVAEPTAAPEIVTQATERWIDIDRSSAMVTLYDGDAVIATFSGKIGRDSAADGFYSTAIGTFNVYSMNKGLAPTPFAEDTYLTDWVGFDPDRKNGIHSPVRDEFGNEKAWQNPSTLGCVRLGAVAAVSVFEFAEIGMRVEVHE